MACNHWLETWDVAIIYTGGNKDLCHCSMNVSWQHDIVPSKIKWNLNWRCRFTCDDWGIPNTKLQFYQCACAAPLCCKNTQLFNCIWQIITYELLIWIVLFIQRCYKTSFPSWWLFLCIWDFGCSCDQTGSGSSGIHGELFYNLPHKIFFAFLSKSDLQYIAACICQFARYMRYTTIAIWSILNPLPFGFLVLLIMQTSCWILLCLQQFQHQ